MLVDHHNSPQFAARTLQVIDHRPIDYKGLQLITSNCLIRIEPVGSCATLIANILLGHPQRTSTPMLEIFRLLYPVIILDTVNFSESAGRGTPKDAETCALIEKLWEMTGTNRWATDVQEYRRKLFDDLVRARSDVSGLSAMKLLYKDMKIVQQSAPAAADQPDVTSTAAASSPAAIVVPIAGLPVLLRDFGALPHSARAVQTLAQCSNADAVLIMTCVFNAGAVRREIAVMQTTETERGSRLYEALTAALLAAEAELELRVQPAEEREDELGGVWYKQQQTALTRKHVMPIVQRVVDGMADE